MFQYDLFFNPKSGLNNRGSRWIFLMFWPPDAGIVNMSPEIRILSFCPGAGF